MDDQSPDTTEFDFFNELKNSLNEIMSQETKVDDRKKRETNVDDEKKKKNRDDSVDRSADSSTSSGIHDYGAKKRETMPGNEMSDMIYQESRVDDDFLLTAGNKEGEKVVSSERKSEKQQPEEIKVDEGSKPRETEVDDEKKKKIRDDSVDPSADSSTTSENDEKNKRGKEKIEMSEIDQEWRVDDDLLLTAGNKEGEKVVSSERESYIRVHQGIKDAAHKKKKKIDPSAINPSTSSGIHDTDHQKMASQEITEVDDEKKKKARDDVVADFCKDDKRGKEKIDEESGENVGIRNVVLPSTFLFAKQLDSTDCFTTLNRVVVDYCREVMSNTLARVKELNKSRHVKVFTKLHPRDTVEYELQFQRYPGGRYALSEWGQIVTAYRLRKGDVVLGCGNRVADDQFRCILYILRDQNSKEQYIP